jgi:hypothetical protein
MVKRWDSLACNQDDKREQAPRLRPAATIMHAEEGD